MKYKAAGLTPEGEYLKDRSGALVQVSRYRDAEERGHKGLATDEDLVVIESFAGVEHADRAFATRERALKPETKQPPSRSIERSDHAAALAESTQMVLGALKGPDDEAFDRDKYEVDVRANRARIGDIQPGAYDSVKFSVAHKQFRVDPTRLRDEDIAQLSLVDPNLADEARAARVGFTKDADDKNDAFLGAMPVSVLGMMKFVAYQVGALKTWIGSIQRVGRENSADLSMLKQRIGNPDDIASKAINGDNVQFDLVQLKSRVALLENRQHLHYAGIWSADKQYSPGALCTDKSGLWIAHQPVAKFRPGGALEACRAWQLIAKGRE